MAAFWYAPNQALLKTRDWFVFMECGLEGHGDTKQQSRTQNHRYEGVSNWQSLGKRQQLTGGRGFRRICSKRTTYKQPIAGTLVSRHLQQHSISHDCFVMSFIITLLIVFTLLRKSMIFTAFAFSPEAWQSNQPFSVHVRDVFTDEEGRHLCVKHCLRSVDRSFRNFTSLDFQVL